MSCRADNMRKNHFNIQHADELMILTRGCEAGQGLETN